MSPRILIAAGCLAALAACGSEEEPTGECTAGETQYCTCVVDAGRILGEEICGADLTWGECACEPVRDGGYVPPPRDAGFRRDAGPRDGGLPLLCSPYDTRSDDDCAIAASAVGTSHTCVQRAWGEVDCFGDDTVGQLGRGSTPAPDLGARWSPQDVIAVDDLLATQIAAAGDYTCVLDMAGDVWCFGSNAEDQLGSGMEHTTLMSSRVPLKVSGVEDVDAITVSRTHACAYFAAQGVAFCWGSNENQQLGRQVSGASLPSSPSPDKIAGLTGIAGVVVGDGFTCAFDNMGIARCVGRSENGELGDGVATRPESGSLVVVQTPATQSVTQMAAGRQHACALLDDRTVWCWGSNTKGQLGLDGTMMLSATPVQIVFEDGSPLDSVRSITSGGDHTCAMQVDRTVICWGDHIALCDPEESMKPVRPRPMYWFGVNARAITAGLGHSCAVRNDRRLHCIGRNEVGQSFPGAPDAECLHDLPIDILQ